MTIRKSSFPAVQEAAHETKHGSTNGTLQRPAPQASPPSGKPQTSHGRTTTQPGPMVKSTPTTTTLYVSSNLKASGLIPALHDLINEAFAVSHDHSGMLPSTRPRLQSHEQLVRELSAPDTFTYVVTYAGTEQVIGVASAKLYNPTKARVPPTREALESAFKRSGPVESNVEGWELSSMAVDPTLQRQGLAGWLMGLVEGEVKRRFLLARVERGTPELGLVMLLSTIKEIREEFYKRKGFRSDYETFQEPGWLGSSKGFTVVHMSKRVEL